MHPKGVWYVALNAALIYGLLIAVFVVVFKNGYQNDVCEQDDNLQVQLWGLVIIYACFQAAFYPLKVLFAFQISNKVWYKISRLAELVAAVIFGSLFAVSVFGSDSATCPAKNAIVLLATLQMLAYFGMIGFESAVALDAP
jgi:hypothetical protein